MRGCNVEEETVDDSSAEPTHRGCYAANASMLPRANFSRPRARTASTSLAKTNRRKSVSSENKSRASLVERAEEIGVQQSA